MSPLGSWPFHRPFCNLRAAGWSPPSAKEIVISMNELSHPFLLFFYILETVYLRCRQAGFGVIGRLALEPGPASCYVLQDSGSPSLKWGW